MFKVFKFVFLTLLIAGCAPEKPTIWTAPPMDKVDCGEYANVITELGVLNNNVWNKGAATDNRWVQCLVTKNENSQTVYGWYWDWPRGRKVIYAYPQIKRGASPWAPEPKFDDRFPLKIDTLETLNIQHHLETQTNGEHNTATSLWIVDEPYDESQPNPSIISTEIMIWTFATEGHFPPAGTKSDEISLNGIVWEDWNKKRWTDQSGVNDNTWGIVTFKSKTNILVADIDALQMLKYAIAQRLLSENLYIADIELGNEIMGDAGVSWVRQFNLQVEQKL